MITDIERKLGRALTEQEQAGFWARVDRSELNGGCWVWTSPPNKDGYGVRWFGGAPLYATALLTSWSKGQSGKDCLFAMAPAAKNGATISASTPTTSQPELPATMQPTTVSGGGAWTSPTYR